jgi:uncharacterized protein (DUF58 family)
VRAWQPGDSPRHIDWKATAKAQELTVREFAAEDEKRVTVILDDRIPQAGENRPTLREKLDAEQRGEGVVISRRFEKALSIAAAIITKFSDENAIIRLVINADIGEFGRGPAHLHDSLRRLALAEPQLFEEFSEIENAEIFSRAINERYNYHLFFITANSTKTLLPDGFRSLKIISI